MKNNAEAFNSKVSVGDEVIYIDDFDVEHKTRTRTLAWDIGSGSTLVSIEGKTGGYDVDRIMILHSVHF